MTAPEKILTCSLCPHRCRLAPGQTGFCRARTNREGTICPDNYGFLTALALDPIEKKPLAMYRPGSMILSVGSFGCSMDCPFCQNSAISMAGPEDIPWEYVSPEQLADMACSLRTEGNIGVAFTYNEPLVSWEYAADTAQLLHDRNMDAVLVSNGCVSPAAARRIIPLMDAMNIDLKTFTESGYRTLGGSLSMVMDFLETAASSSAHLEITTLIVPDISDRPEDMEREAAWIASLDPEIPLHITRYFPRYHYDCPATDTALIRKIAAVAREHLSHVFIGNC